MTIADKERIHQLRGDGLSYKSIADRLEISAASVKSFCHRYGVVVAESVDGACQQCGKPLGKRLPGAEQKKFCSDTCRNKWWNRHTHLREPKEAERRVCAHCGHVFHSRKDRKYCGHPCYISSRFGGERLDTRTV